MHKLIITIFFLWCTTQAAIGQGKVEHIVISWPGEYNWKIVKQTHDENTQTSMIIPGNDSISNPSIIGSLTVYRGAKFSKLEDIITHYKAGLDSGSRLTPLERSQNTKYSWIIFKVETPANNKYAEPESDLYYVVQGKFGLYENFVGIKAATLSDEFVKKWTAVFMTGQITTE
jgi:hypothetical protein